MDSSQETTQKCTSEQATSQEQAIFSSFTTYDRPLVETLYDISRNVPPPKNSPYQAPSKTTSVMSGGRFLIVCLIILLLSLTYLGRSTSPLIFFLLLFPWITIALFFFYSYRKKLSEEQIQLTRALLLEGQTVVFYDSYLTASSSQPGFSSQLSIYYSELKQIIETPKQFFFTLPNKTFIAVAKSGLIDFTPKESSDFLKSVSQPGQYVYYTPKIKEGAE